MSASLSSIGKQVTIYVGTFIFIAGVIGCLLNIFVLFSLRTFRQSSCAFYLTIMSIINVSILFFGLFSRVWSNITNVDATETSLFYCKFRLYSTQITIGSSLTCWCLATIDQYFATCSRPRWQQFCDIKLAQRLVILTMIFWTLHGIPYLVFYNHVVSSTTNRTTCINTNFLFDEYRGYIILLVLLGYIPIAIAGIFGSMAYYNVRHMAYRTVPLVRRELDKQLTLMVLIQVIVSIFTLLPYTTSSTVAANKTLMSDQNIQAKVQFSVTVTFIFFYTTFACPFYIYVCVSERYRRQLIYVLTKIHLNPWNRTRVDINQIVPET